MVEHVPPSESDKVDDRFAPRVDTAPPDGECPDVGHTEKPPAEPESPRPVKENDFVGVVSDPDQRPRREGDSDDPDRHRGA